MQYILTEEERKNLINKEELDFEKEKLTMLLKEYRKIGCRKSENIGYCDDCPIASLNNKLSKYSALCKDQDFSK